LRCGGPGDHNYDHYNYDDYDHDHYNYDDYDYDHYNYDDYGVELCEHKWRCR
jgi:hypothetical protein